MKAPLSRAFLTASSLLPLFMAGCTPAEEVDEVANGASGSEAERHPALDRFEGFGGGCALELVGVQRRGFVT